MTQVERASYQDWASIACRHSFDSRLFRAASTGISRAQWRMSCRDTPANRAASD